MNIFIFTLGTRGDVQPYIALAQGLNEAGHRATLCTSSRFAGFAREHGVATSDFTDAFMELVDSDEARAAMGSPGNPIEYFKRMRALIKKSGLIQSLIMAKGWDAARAADPDLIVFHPKAYGGTHFAEKLGIPSVLALVMPGLVPTGAFPALGFPQLRLGRTYNRATYHLLLGLTRRMFSKYINPWRRQNGLPPQKPSRSMLQNQAGEHIPVLHGYSRFVALTPADWGPNVSTTGFWFLKPHDWNPPSDLIDFLNSGAPPVYVGFGSMADDRAQERTRLVLDALGKAKARGVISSGWGGLTKANPPPGIHFIKNVPHEWLFPRVAAVVHHGGSGTTAAGLRAGKPTVICPFVADQPFWGRSVYERGLGPAPIPQRKLSSENLKAAVQAAVSDPQIRTACAEVALKIERENGVENAVRVLESFFRTRNSFN